MRAWPLLKESFREWRRDNAGQLAASTAYYTVFSLAPLVVLAISFAGLFVERGTAESALFRELESLVGTQGAATVRMMVESSQASPQTPLAAVLGFTVLLIGASSLLVALQNALNYIWKVEPNANASHLAMFVLKRILSFGMVLSVGFLLLVSLLLSTLTGLLLGYLSEQGLSLSSVLPAGDALASFAVHTFLFASLFKFLPDVRITWKDVVPGAFLTAALFTLGKIVLGLYLGQQNFTAVYGVAGSVVVLLLWVNYSAQILFFGAEFTKVYSRSLSPEPTPRSYAHFTSDAEGHAVKKQSWFSKVFRKR